MSNQGASATIRLGDKATPVERTAAEILAEVLSTYEPGRGAIISVGTPASSHVVAERASRWRLDESGDEGFVVERVDDDTPRHYVVASRGSRGILYGCAALADQIRLGNALDDISLRDKPILADRNLWAWSGPSSDEHAFFSFPRMLNVENEPDFRRLGRYLAQARINTLTLWPQFSNRPDCDDAKPHVLEAYRRFTRFFRERYGLEFALFMWYEVNQGTPTPINGWPICPFNQRVIAYWNRRITGLAEALPDVRGIVMAGAGGDWVRGPFECQCPRCRQHSNRELIIRAMEMIGKPWVDAGGRIIWKAVTDRPTLVTTEVENFANLDDDLPPYVRIAHKNFYKDFRPVHPLHPMFYAHKDQTEKARPYLCEFQIYGEYRGGTDFPCVMVDRWGQIAPLLARKNYAGLMAVCSFAGQDAWDHPLNLANWYAFGRYAWNPNASPDAVYRDWATLTFGQHAADAVIDVCRLSYQASTKLMFFKGVMVQNHSKLPTIDYELESSLVGPWHDIPKAPDGLWGRGHDVSMYPPEVADAIRNDPDLQLWVHRVEITPAMCDEGIAEQREAVRLVHQMVERWEAIPHTGWDELHHRIGEQLKRNVVDAELWCEDLTLYYDYKAGRLTRGELTRRLEEIQTRFDINAGTDLIRHTFDRFIEEWQRVLAGNLTRRSMEGDYHNPAGEPFLPGLRQE